MIVFILNNISWLIASFILIAFMVIYRNALKDGLVFFGRSLLFIARYPAVLSFTLLRLVMFALLDVAIFAWFFPNMGWKSFMTQPIQRLFSIFQQMCLPVLPCGFIIVFLFLLVGFLVSIATVHYVLARVSNQAETSPYSINVAILSMPQILAWSMLYAPVYYGILTKQPFLLPLMLLLTFFVTVAIAQGYKNIAQTLIRAIQIMQANIGKVLIFGVLFGLIGLTAGVAILQGYRYLSIICYCVLAILVTIRDIFKALVSPQI